MKQKRYTVEGTGTFPDDMLRYDSARYATVADEFIAQDSRSGRRQVDLIGPEPTVGRWESFMWRVVKPNRYFQKEARW